MRGGAKNRVHARSWRANRNVHVGRSVRVRLLALLLDGPYRGQFQRTIERAKITIFKANLRNHHDRVNHFPAFPSMICDFRSHKFFLGKVQCQFLEKTYTLLLHLFGAQNKTPQVFFRNVRQYCTNLCFNHCFVHLIRFLLGPCGPYSTQI